MRPQRLPRIVVTVALALASALAGAPGALATVTFDTSTGLGFVDKADVQGAYGWNDHQFQANARKVSFHAEQTVSWSWQCLIGGQLTTLTTDPLMDRWAVDSTAVGSTVGKRVTGVTGFALDGPGATDPGSAPSCPSGEPTGVTSFVTTQLFADFRGASRVVWQD